MFDDHQLLLVLDLSLSLRPSLSGCLWRGVAFSARFTLSDDEEEKKGGAIFQLNNCRRQVFTFVGQTQPSRKIAQGAEENREQAQATNDD